MRPPPGGGEACQKRMGQLYARTFMQTSPTIPGYHLFERLDAGGLADVWRACGPDNKPCALKLVSTSDALASARFLRERELLQGVVHPRVVHALAVGSTTDWHWLAMPQLLRRISAPCWTEECQRMPAESATKRPRRWGSLRRARWHLRHVLSPGLFRGGQLPV